MPWRHSLNSELSFTQLRLLCYVAAISFLPRELTFIGPPPPPHARPGVYAVADRRLVPHPSSISIELKSAAELVDGLGRFHPAAPAHALKAG